MNAIRIFLKHAEKEVDSFRGMPVDRMSDGLFERGRGRVEGLFASVQESCPFSDISTLRALRDEVLGDLANIQKSAATAASRKIETTMDI